MLDTHSLQIQGSKHARCDILDAGIHINEVVSAVKRLKCGKSPGGDGMPPELCKYLSESSLELISAGFLVTVN